MRNCLVFILSHLLTIPTLAQIGSGCVDFHSSLSYGNQSWVQYRLNEQYEYSRFGGLSLSRIWLGYAIDSLALQLDSVPTSSLDFSIGTRANQSLRAGLVLPISNDAALKFQVVRESNPGWMVRSHARNTTLNGEVEMGRSEKLRANYSIHYSDASFEQNGGLRGPTLSLDSEDGQFQRINSNVWLSNAESRSSSLRIVADHFIRIKELKSFRLEAVHCAQLKREKYSFADAQPDSSYYSRFDPDRAGGVDHELRANILYNAVSIRLTSLGDSVRTRTIEVGAGNQLYGMSLGTNDIDGSNNYFLGAFHFVRQGHSIDMRGHYFISGLTSGGYEGIGKYSYTLMRKERTYAYLFTELLTSSERVAQVYERFAAPWIEYESMDLDFTRKTTVAVGVDDGRDSKVMVQYSRTDDFIFFDSTLTVNQATGAIELLRIAAQKSIPLGTSIQVRPLVHYNYLIQSASIDFPKWNIALGWSHRISKVGARAEVRYHLSANYLSSFYAPGFLPTHGEFYFQRDFQSKPLVRLDAKVQFTVKKTSIILGVENATYGWLTEQTLVAPYYPMVPSFFSIRVKWDFVD